MIHCRMCTSVWFHVCLLSCAIVKFVVSFNHGRSYNSAVCTLITRTRISRSWINMINGICKKQGHRRIVPSFLQSDFLLSPSPSRDIHAVVHFCLYSLSTNQRRLPTFWHHSMKAYATSYLHKATLFYFDGLRIFLAFV